MVTEEEKGGREGRGPLERQLEEERKRSEELLTRLKYAQADLENYRKRSDRELREAGEAQTRGLALRLIVVLDELDMALRHAEGPDNGELAEGLKMVRGNLRSALQSVGVEPIDAAGMPFDPAVHEAVEKSQGGETGPDRVVEVVRPGYTFRGQLLRPSMVKVELASAAAEEAKASE